MPNELMPEGARRQQPAAEGVPEPMSVAANAESERGEACRTRGKLEFRSPSYGQVPLW